MRELTDEEREYLGEPKPEPKPKPKPEKLSTEQPKPYQNVSQPTDLPNIDPKYRKSNAAQAQAEAAKTSAHNDNCAISSFCLTYIPLVILFTIIFSGNWLGLILAFLYLFTAGIPLAIVAIINGIIGLKSTKHRALAIISLIPYGLILVGIFGAQSMAFLRF